MQATDKKWTVQLLGIIFIMNCIFCFREILEDALAVVSRRDGLSHLLASITAGNITGERAAWILTSLAYARPKHISNVTDILVIIWNKVNYIE